MPYAYLSERIRCLGGLRILFVLGEPLCAAGRPRGLYTRPVNTAIRNRKLIDRPVRMQCGTCVAWTKKRYIVCFDADYAEDTGKITSDGTRQGL